MTEAGWSVCAECGMGCNAGEYHPYAACLMFMECRNSETVRANLQAVREHSYQQGRVAGLEEAARRADKIGNQSSSSHVRSVVGLIVMDLYEQLAQAAQEGGAGDVK